jgi:cysteinyl-tRNA synthetase
MFAFMNEGHAAMDAGERPGPEALSAWNGAEGVLGVTSTVVVMKVSGGSGGDGDEDPLSRTPPPGAAAAEDWARSWAARRAQFKRARNYAEADRIRALLGEHGFEVRDSRDGSIEVVRLVRPAQ